MIYSLTGKIIKKTLNAVVICCGGVGYYAQCPASVAGALPGVGNEATIYTVMNVTENDVSLYGFSSEEQQACFELLTSVSGVGAKVGLAILSVMEPDRVALAISAGDHKAFKAASGVGPKLAQRIVLELKDKVAKGFAAGIDLENVAGAASDTAAAQGAGQAIAALVSLGYSQSEIAVALKGIDVDGLALEEIIKQAADYAKQIAAEQSAGRLEGKRVMKRAAYAEVFEIMFRFLLAYADTGVTVKAGQTETGNEYRTFNRYDFLEKDDAGEYYWNDEFLFSVDSSTLPAGNRELMWKEAKENFSNGAYGNPSEDRARLLYWTELERLHYPHAKEVRDSIIKNAEQTKNENQTREE